MSPLWAVFTDAVAASPTPLGRSVAVSPLLSLTSLGDPGHSVSSLVIEVMRPALEDSEGDRMR